MRLCVVPMKRLDRAKERLGEVLDAVDRRRLALAMLSDVLAAASALDEVWVINSDDDAAEVAARAGARPVADPEPDGGLNASLNAVTSRAITDGATGVLVLSADLPAVTADDVRAVALGEGVVIAPDRAGTGTNALWRRPPAAIACVYGERSRTAHEALAHVRGVACAVVARERLAIDVDAPRDLHRIAEVGAGPATTAVLDSLGYPGARR